MVSIQKLSFGFALSLCVALAPLKVLASPDEGEQISSDPSSEPADKPAHPCDIPPPHSTPPTDDFKRVLLCLGTLGLKLDGRLSCTDTDIRRPPTCPPEPGSPKEDPTGYTNCGYQQTSSPETAAFYQEMMNDLDISADAETASMLATPQKSGAAWVECNQSASTLLETALHEVCHLIKQCDKNKAPDEQEAAECTKSQLDRIRKFKSYTLCRKLLREGSLATTSSSTE
ncbi:MAG: hypothetical protein U0136_08125 [Bdellovibrionota bacterium]